VALAFALFRAFDILKPWPVSWADGLAGATGVMLDDILAGAMAGAVLVLGAALWNGGL
jgi:phosphatidylglycerophosphatase A